VTVTTMATIMTAMSPASAAAVHVHAAHVGAWLHGGTAVGVLPSEDNPYTADKRKGYDSYYFS